MTTFLIGLAIAGLAALFFVLKPKRSSKTDMAAFTQGVKEAAAAGEKAYRAQVELLSNDRGLDANIAQRGIALARFLCASFPAAAYGSVAAANALHPSIQKSSPVKGNDIFKLASGAALMPLGIDSESPDLARIKDDSNEAARDYIDYFSNHFGADPIAGLAAAEAHLSSHWQKALEFSLGPIGKNIHTTQFCASGLHLYAVWVQALRK